MRVLVLMGGTSDEREVSLRSGKAVVGALKSAGHEVVEYDPAEGYSGLAVYQGKVDCAFPILHGRGGEDGEVQKELENRGFKYLGSDSKVSKLCFDKVEFKKILNLLSILTPEWKMIDKDSIRQSRIITQPYVLKPIDGGSSIDTYIIRDPKKSKHDENVFTRHSQMLAEELVTGDEITISMLGQTPLPVIEIIPPKGEEFDYENKYNGASQEICPPKNISAEKQIEAQSIAGRIHKELGVRHLSRTDIMIDATGNMFVLELNTIPGLTDQSLFPKAAQQAGLSFERLVQKFVEMVLAS